MIFKYIELLGDTAFEKEEKIYVPEEKIYTQRQKQLKSDNVGKLCHGISLGF